MIAFITSVVMLVIFLPIPIILFLLHTCIRLWRKIGRATYRIAAVVWFALGVLIILLRKYLLTSALSFPLSAKLIGLLLVAGGFVLSAVAQKHLSLQRLIGMPQILPEVRKQRLITTGIYGKIRHPRYLSYILILEGWFLFSGYIVFPVIALALLVIIPLEEHELIKRFGQAYLKYRQQVPALAPQLWSRKKQ